MLAQRYDQRSRRKCFSFAFRLLLDGLKVGLLRDLGTIENRWLGEMNWRGVEELVVVALVNVIEMGFVAAASQLK